MSVHLVQCAAAVELNNPRLKIAFMCFAESGQGTERIARPGFRILEQWTNASRSQVYHLVEQLVELQLVARHRQGYRGHTAEFVVFPNGCCEVHGKHPAAPVVDGADVVEMGPIHGQTQSAIHSVRYASDPLPEKGSDLDPGKGPISPEKGSDLDPGKGPIVEREIGALQEHSNYQSPTTDTPSGHQQQPLTSRDPSPVVDFDFSRVDQPIRGVRVAPPHGGRALGCRHCDAGYICDADGIPITHCPHCNPRAKESAS